MVILNLDRYSVIFSIHLLCCEILGGLDGNTCFPNEAHASSGDGLTGARARRQAPLTVSLIWVPPWPGLIHLDGVTMAELSEPPKITGCFIDYNH